MIIPPELPINDEARNDAHIASTGVAHTQDCHIKTKRVTSDASKSQLNQAS